MPAREHHHVETRCSPGPARSRNLGDPVGLRRCRRPRRQGIWPGTPRGRRQSTGDRGGDRRGCRRQQLCILRRRISRLTQVRPIKAISARPISPAMWAVAPIMGSTRRCSGAAAGCAEGCADPVADDEGPACAGLADRGGKRGPIGFGTAWRSRRPRGSARLPGLGAETGSDSPVPWDQYRGEIFSVAVVVVLQTLLISVLAVRAPPPQLCGGRIAPAAVGGGALEPRRHRQRDVGLHHPRNQPAARGHPEQCGSGRGTHQVGPVRSRRARGHPRRHPPGRSAGGGNHQEHARIAAAKRDRVAGIRPQ